MTWFRDLVELQDDAKDASEFMDFVKEDLFKDQVYVFTPNGEVMELPTGSGPSSPMAAGKSASRKGKRVKR